MGYPDSRDGLILAAGNKTNNEPTRVLSGWKEIACYLGRGVRTVQRWEKLGLPVRRPNAHLRSAVLTGTSEIDAWMRCCGNGRPEAQRAESKYDLLAAMVEQLRSENQELRSEVEALKRRTQSGRGASENRVASSNVA